MRQNLTLIIPSLAEGFCVPHTKEVSVDYREARKRDTKRARALACSLFGDAWATERPDLLKRIENNPSGALKDLSEYQQNQNCH